MGSKDGWKPREDTNHQQTKEDFMDEQDFNEWGGPNTIREEYNNNSGQPKNDSQQQQQQQQHTATTLKLTSWARIEPPPNVGKRLLRVLGWRTGSTAYVPTDQGNTSNNNNNTTAADGSSSSLEESFLFLSSRRLKKIRLQQSRVKIPEPKLDTCGLGYDVYHGAPEFQAHQEKRKRAARERAKAVTGNRGDNVYRLSSTTTAAVTVDGQDKPSNKFTNGEMTTSDSYAGFETVEDFVGKRTVGGFAIREDEDDVYDEAPLTKESETLRIDKDQYDTEIYDHDSDDPDGKTGTASAAATEVKGLFANWASSPPTTTTNDTRKEENRGVTSDGRRPLTGFVLGGSSGGKSPAALAQRYPGPDLPFNYLVTKHQFHPKECPDVLGIQSRLDQEQERLRQASVARQQRFQQEFQKKRQEQRQQQGVLDKKAPMAGTSFAGLANAIKNRFTTSTTSNDDTNHNQSMSERSTGTSGGGGLRQPSLEPSPEVPKETERPPPLPKEIRVVRSVMLFSPDVLLCKRLGVTPPKHAQRGGSKAVVAPTQEENYFQTEILKHVEANNTTNNDKPPQTTNDAGSSRSSKANAKLNEILDKDDGERLAKETDTRPGMDVYKSIFEPESESDSDDAASEADAEPKRSEISLQQTRQGVGAPKAQEQQQQGAVGDKQPNPQKQGGTDEATNGQLVLRQPEENGGAGRKRPRGRNNDDDNDDDSDATTDLDASSTDEERRRHRRRKERRRREKKRKRKREEKKRRKKHKSSKKGRTRD